MKIAVPLVKMKAAGKSAKLNLETSQIDVSRASDRLAQTGVMADEEDAAPRSHYHKGNILSMNCRLHQGIS
jgi:hypothetical protein